MYINSMGQYVPSQRIPNEYFTSVNGLTPEWIEQRTGIRSRSKTASDENVDTMGIKAVEDALKTLPYDIKDVNL
ncbi:MAG: ketoacyl-ACP synthase III, partial [Muribaculaceae bacterium]|nr:ketoacyl-ACP synthase III [Muribaculaceae bacterium]